jgi:hypothetical protein
MLKRPVTYFCTAYFIGPLTLLCLLAPLVNANAQTPAINGDNQPQVRYYKSKDSRYLYVKTPLTINLFNPAQRAALDVSLKRMKEHLEFIRDKSPRTGLNGKIDQSLLDEASRFDQSIDSLVNYMQKFFAEVQPTSRLAKLSMPTGLMVFSGVDWSKGIGLSFGVSIVVGAVFVPMQVQQVHVDTGEVTNYVEWDSNLVVWPMVKAGVGVNTGLPGKLLGAGLIWGRLDQATDFQGLVLGASQTGKIILGFNHRLQVMKNFKKPGAFSNLFWTVAWDTGAADIFAANPIKWEFQGNASWIVDAGSYFASPVGNPTEIISSVGSRLVERQRDDAANAQQQQHQQRN